MIASIKETVRYNRDQWDHYRKTCAHPYLF